MPAVTDTRERLIEAAGELFWERGYAGVGLAEIASAAGARQGSLYHFFPTKDDLLLAVIERQSVLILGAIDSAMSRHEPGVERVLAVFEFYRRFMERTGCGLGCPMTNLAGEVADALPRASARIAAFNAALTDRVAGALEAGGWVRPDAFARALVAMAQGAVTQARADRTVEAVDAVIEVASVMLRAGPLAAAPDGRSASPERCAVQGA